MVTEGSSESRMRSRTSRGVPEWSGGEDLYIGRRVLESGSVPGVPGYGQHDQKVFRGPRQVLQGLIGQGEGANQPTKGLSGPTPFTMLLGEVGRLHLTWEASLHLAWLGGQVSLGFS